MQRAHFIRTATALLVLGAACTPPQIAGPAIDPMTTKQAFAGHGAANCSAVHPQTEPDLMAWDAESRAKVARLRGEGVIAVRYRAKGCEVELEVLDHCIGKGAYKFAPYSANETKIAHNANELYATLPLGAANLSGKLSGERALRTDYMLVGTYALPPGVSFSATALSGPDCARATHVVSAVYVGGFAMAAGEKRAMAGAASMFGARAGGGSAASMDTLADEGQASACRDAQQSRSANDGCAVPLRVGLLALEGAQANADTPVADRVVSVAALSPVPPAPLDGGMKLDADADALVAYDAALKADQSGRIDPGAAVDAWTKLAAITKGNPFVAVATQRAGRWREYAAKKKTRDEQKKIDDERLTKILPLDSVAAQQKEQLLDAYVRLYGRVSAGRLLPLVTPAAARTEMASRLGLLTDPMGERKNAWLYEACEGGNLQPGNPYAPYASDGGACARVADMLAKAPIAAEVRDEAIAETLQLACDRGSARACTERASGRDVDARDGAALSKRAADLSMEACVAGSQQKPEVQFSVGSSCQAAWKAFRAAGDAAKADDANRRAAIAFAAYCAGGTDARVEASCDQAMSHAQSTKDPAFIRKITSSVVERRMAKCQESGDLCLSAIDDYVALNQMENARTAYKRLLVDASPRCARGAMDQCFAMAEAHKLVDERAKAAAAYASVCNAPNPTDGLDVRSTACREASRIYAKGASGLPASRDTALRLLRRECTLRIGSMSSALPDCIKDVPKTLDDLVK